MYLNSRKKYSKIKHIEHLNHKNDKKLSAFRNNEGEEEGHSSSSEDHAGEIF